MARFTEEQIEMLKNEKIFLCICATGKSYLASVDPRFVDIDQEEANYKFGYDGNMLQDEFSKLQGHGKVIRDDSESYIHNKIFEYLKNGKIILSATHKHILKFLQEQKLPYVIIQYPASDVNHFKDRMRGRGNTEDFIEAMLGHRAEAYITHKNDPFATAVLDIYKGEYLSELMWEIFGKPKN